MLVVMVIVANYFFDQVLVKKEHSKIDKATNEAMNNTAGTHFKKLSFKDDEEVYLTNKDALRMAGFIKKGHGKTWIITSHGYKSNHMQDLSLAAPFLYTSDYNLLMIDHQASGASEGNVYGFGVGDYQALQQWITYLKERYGSDINIFLWGLSMGASTVLYVASSVPSNVKGIIADCGYTSPYEEYKFMLKHYIHIPSWPLMPLFRLVVLLRGHYDIKASVTESISNSLVPIMYITGEDDTFVPPECTKNNYEHTSSLKEIHWFKGAGHAMSYQSNPKEYEKLVYNFINKYDK